MFHYVFWYITVITGPTMKLTAKFGREGVLVCGFMKDFVLHAFLCTVDSNLSDQEVSCCTGTFLLTTVSCKACHFTFS